MSRGNITIWLIAATLISAGPGARAQNAADDQESPAHRIARTIGLAAPEPQVEDFVRDSRPLEPGVAIPVFSPPAEPDSEVRSNDSLNAMDSELDATAKANQKLLAASAAPAPGPRPHRKKKPAPAKSEN